MADRETSDPLINSLILNFSWMWLALQFSFHRLFCEIFQTVLDSN